MHVEPRDLPGDGLVLHVTVLVHDVLPPLGVVDEGGDVGHDANGLAEVRLVPVIVLGRLREIFKTSTTFHVGDNVYSL